MQCPHCKRSPAPILSQIFYKKEKYYSCINCGKKFWIRKNFLDIVLIGGFWGWVFEIMFYFIFPIILIYVVFLFSEWLFTTLLVLLGLFLVLRYYRKAYKTEQK